jgi:hypothetical protein
LLKLFWNYQVQEDDIGVAYFAKGEKKTVYMLLLGKQERKRPPGKPKYRWMDNVKVVLVGRL